MTDNTKSIYQAMFLLDNQEVRKGFNTQRDWLQQMLEKHGITVRVLRFWGERKLAYPIRRKHRGTYLLGWLEASGQAVNEVKRDLYLVGPVFRCLFLREDAIPEEELAFGIEQVDEAALEIPDDAPEEIEEEPYVEAEDPKDKDKDKSEGEAESKSDDSSDKKSEEKPEAKAEGTASSDAEPVGAAPEATEKKEG